MSEPRQASPSIKVCLIDEAARCTVCGLTIYEIARWAQMSAQEQWDVVARLAHERGNPAEPSRNCDDPRRSDEPLGPSLDRDGRGDANAAAEDPPGSVADTGQAKRDPASAGDGGGSWRPGARRNGCFDALGDSAVSMVRVRVGDMGVSPMPGAFAVLDLALERFP